ncbi:MAG: hypothetical protein KGI33_12350 [Thaumarchaeota archaeon]|nr:hypothetical protein [Nitrososphaerota archaeon]
MAEKKEEKTEENPGVLKRLSKDLGLEDDFVRDVSGDLIKTWVKEKTGLSRNFANKSKFGRTVETLKGTWWIPAALIISVGVAILTIKLIAKFAGVDI